MFLNVWWIAPNGMRKISKFLVGIVPNVVGKELS